MSPGDGTAERVMLWQSPPATDPAWSSGLGLPVTERVNVTGGWHSRASHAVATPSRYGSRIIVRPRVASDRARHVTGGWHSRVSHAVAGPSRCGLHLLVRPRVASGGAWPMPPGGGAAEPVMLRQSPPAAAPYSTSGPGIGRDGGRLPVTLLEPLEPRQEMRQELCHTSVKAVQAAGKGEPEQAPGSNRPVERGRRAPGAAREHRGAPASWAGRLPTANQTFLRGPRCSGSRKT